MPTQPTRSLIVAARSALDVRLVWISPVCPLPLTDGNRHRHYHLLRQTAREHRVTLVCPVTPTDCELLAPLAAEGVDLRLVDAVRSPRGRVRAGLRREPACIVPPDIDGLTETVRSLAPADVVFGPLSVAPAVAEACGSRQVIDEQNVETDLYDRLWRAESLRPRKLARLLDWREVARYETAWLNMADAVTVCSERDQARLAELAPQQEFRVIPNGVDLEHVQFRGHRPEGGPIIFVGGMGWAPNVDAATILAQKIMPIVWGSHPDVELLLVGKDPVPEVQRLAGHQVRVTGAVPDIGPYLERASLTIVPLRSGGGTRLKILEAMGSGVPVLSTTVGAEGLGLSDGRDAVIRDSVAELGAAAVELIRNPRQAAEIARAARQRVEQDFGWAAIAQRLVAVFGDR